MLPKKPSSNNSLKGIIKKSLAGIAVSGVLATTIYFCHTETIENATVVDKGVYGGTVLDCHTLDNSCFPYQLTQTKIQVDNYDKCLRGPADLSMLEIGDKLKFIEFRPGIFGPCDYAVEYLKE